MKKIFAVAALAMASPVIAEGGYVGLGVGQMTVKDIEVMDVSSTIDTDVEDTDTYFQVFGGYQFNPNFAAELAYINFGSASVEYSDSVDFIKSEVEAHATTFSILGLLPVQENINLFGRIGVAIADVDGKITSSFLDSMSESGSSNNPYFGIGIQYDFGEAMIRAEFNTYKDVGDEDKVGESDIDTFGISAAVKF